MAEGEGRGRGRRRVRGSEGGWWEGGGRGGGEGDGSERRAAAPCHGDVNKGFRSLLSALVCSSSTFDSFWSTCGHLLSLSPSLALASVFYNLCHGCCFCFRVFECLNHNRALNSYAIEAHTRALSR